MTEAVNYGKTWNAALFSSEGKFATFNGFAPYPLEEM